MQIEQQERELAYRSRFASNLAYSQSHAINGPSSLIAQNQLATPSDSSIRPQVSPALSSAFAAPQYGPPTTGSQAPNLTQPQGAPEVSNDLRAQNGYKRPAEVNINSATGQPYVVYEGTLIETALMNRLDGDASGPVKVLVTNPVYSHDHQHILIPDGTVVLGETHKIGNTEFGHQRRLAVVFHRMIMPDGYSVDLDQFLGLNQIGETGLKDKVNNHYFQIFGSSIALGIIAGAAEVSNSGGALTGNGTDAYKYGVASSLSQSATTILDQFINIPPTITIREGHRVKVYISQDLLLPAYENHTIPSTL
jgi:type IV secretion system protein VirB10